MNCPCLSGAELKTCCEPFINGQELATSPEVLMRSRYVAYCQKNIDYIEETTDPQASLDFDREAALEWMNEAEFTKLEILNSTNEGNKGTVEFKAYFRTKEGEEIHHEVSKFRKQNGQWYFRDGRVKDPAAQAKN